MYVNNIGAIIKGMLYDTIHQVLGQSDSFDPSIIEPMAYLIYQALQDPSDTNVNLAKNTINLSNYSSKLRTELSQNMQDTLGINHELHIEIIPKIFLIPDSQHKYEKVEATMLGENDVSV